MEEEIAWYDIGYRWWILKYWAKRQPDRCAWWVANHLPRRIALLTFVRVYSAWGECGPDYEHVYKAWEALSPGTPTKED